MIAIQTSERNGKVVAATLVDPNDEIMLITSTGVLIRTRVSEIREMGRATQGVTLISVDDGGRLSGVQKVVESAVELIADEAAEGADAAPGSEPGPDAAGDSGTEPAQDE
jgi:DNA gyrase subunit A